MCILIQYNIYLCFFPLNFYFLLTFYPAPTLPVKTVRPLVNRNYIKRKNTFVFHNRFLYANIKSKSLWLHNPHIKPPYGGGDGELGALLRYLSQRFTMVTPQAKATCNDIGTEEIAHLEMMGAIVQQLTQGLTDKQIIEAGLDPYYVAHGLGVYPSAASGVPFTAAYLQSSGDPICDLYENMAAEQKALKTYNYLLDLTNDPDVIAPLKFLRERETVHFQRFGEALDIVRDYLNENNFFVMPKPDFMK